MLEDKGDEVELGVPEDRVPYRRGGYVIHIPAGNTTVVAKSDLVLATLGQESVT